MLGTCNPGMIMSKKEFDGYNLNDFDRKHFRVFTVIASRDTDDQLTIPMYFDGAVNYFEPLPPPNDIKNLSRFISLVHRNRSEFIYIPNNIDKFIEPTVPKIEPNLSFMNLNYFINDNKRRIIK